LSGLRGRAAILNQAQQQTILSDDVVLSVRRPKREQQG